MLPFNTAKRVCALSRLTYMPFQKSLKFSFNVFGDSFGSASDICVIEMKGFGRSLELQGARENAGMLGIQVTSDKKNVGP